MKSTYVPKITTKFELSKEATEIIKRMIVEANNEKFPDKDFTVGGQIKHYCSYLHFTNSDLDIEDLKTDVIYTCILCKAQLICKPGNSRNIKKHLWTYCRRKDYIRKWMELYDTSQSNYKQKKKLTDSQLKLVQFFISTRKIK